MNQAHATNGGPVTPKARMSGNSVATNPYRGDQGRYPAAPYVTYAETGGRSQNAAVEEIDNSCVVYVGGLTNMTDDRILYDTFRQFGPIVSLVRRSVNFDVRPNSTMTQYAFIGFGNSQDAQEAIRKGEITLGDRKLIIKPRDKPGMSYHKHISHGYHNPQAYKDKHGDEGRDQILQLLNKNVRTGQPDQKGNTAYEQQQQQHGQQQVQVNEQQTLAQVQADNINPVTYYDGGVSGPPGPKIGTNSSYSGQSPVLMSKALYIANLPIDMSPKELFTLFSDVGLVEGCYIFPYADVANRRFGHIVMSSFYCAQKACEAFNGTTIRGCTLDVSYKTHPGPDGNPISSPIAPFNSCYQPQIQHFSQPFQQQFQQPINFAAPIYHPGFGAQHQQMAWLPQPYGPAPSLITPTGLIPFNHQFPQFPNMIPYAPYNTMGPMSPQGFESQQVNNISPPNSPPFQGFQDPTSGWLGHVPVRPYSSGRLYADHRHNGRGTQNILSNSYSTNFSGVEPHRSVSDSSSTTLVSSGYDRAKFDRPAMVNGPCNSPVIDNGSYRSPVIVNGSYRSPVIVNGSYSSPVVANGSYASSSETPSRSGFDGDTSGSDKDSTPSPVVVRSIPDPQLTPETPTRPSSRPTTFVALTPSVIPETTEPADPANLFIKNLDDAVISDVEELKLLFEPYGTVSSSFLATYPGSGISRGYGFVAFVKPEDASEAKAKLNGSIVGKKRVFVSYAERKEDRTQRLKGLFSGNGELKKEKISNKAEEATPEDKGLVINHTNSPTESDEAIGKPVNLPSRGLTEIPSGESSLGVENSKTIGKHVEEVLVDDIHPIVGQDITRWRGTQLTGIAEDVEEEDLVVHQTSPTLSTSSSYVKSCVAQSPPGRVQGAERSPELSQTIADQPPMVSDQPKAPTPPPGGAPAETPPAETPQEINEQDKIDSPSAAQNNQPQQLLKTSLNGSSTGHGGPGPDQNQNQGQNNGNRYGPRPFYRNNNNTGNFGEKSRLPVPRYVNGSPKMTPEFHAPTGPRLPRSNNGNAQTFYPPFPNNEHLGQQNSGRKKHWKNSGNRRTRDNPATQQSRAQNQQKGDGMVGRVKVAAATL